MPKKEKISLLIIIYLILLNNPVFSVENIRIDKKIGQYRLGTSIEYLEDARKKLTIADIRKDEFIRRFVKSKSEALNFSFTPSAFWIRFNITKKSDAPEEYLLVMDNPPFFAADFYQIDSFGRMKHSVIKLTTPFYKREIPYRKYVFPVRLPHKGEYEFFLRFESNDLMIINPVLWVSKNKFAGHVKSEQILFGIFLGVILIMVLYNFFLFVSLKDINYLYYIILISAIGFYQITMLGLSFEYVWPESPLLNQRASFFLLGVTLFSGVIFTRDFLKIKEFMPKYNIIFLFLLLISFLYVAGSLFLDIVYLSLAGNLIPLIAIIALIVPIIYSIRAGYKPAGYLFCAFLIMAAGALLLVMRNFDIAPHNLFTNHMLQISTVFSVALMSLALADRINLIMKEKNEAEASVDKTRRTAVQSLEKTDELKEQFIVNISHDLREPLNEIIDTAGELMNDSSISAGNAINEKLSRIISSAKKYRNYLNNVIDYSKLKVGDLKLHLKAVDFYEVANIVLFFSNDIARKESIEFVNEISEDIPPVYVDENRIYPVMFNIIENAVACSAPGEIAVKAGREGDFLKISVEFTDSGIHDDISRLLNEDPAPLNPDSISIGLIISKKIIEMHGGTIVFNFSEEGLSRFLFTCPLYMPEKIDVAKDDDPQRNVYLERLNNQKRNILNTSFNGKNEKIDILLAERSSGQNKRDASILIVDDEPVNVQVLVNQLKFVGYKVITASDGYQALDIIKKNIIPDIVLLDIMLPGMSGYEVCSILRQRFSLYSLPVLMVTVKNQIKDMVKGFEAGANDYLTKPYDKMELLSRVDTLITLKRIVKQYEITKYRELQKRMNPHFLFNALHSIHALMKKKPDDADRGILMLADIFRFLMDRSFESVIPFELEWEFVKNYLDMEMLRFSDVMKYEMSVTGNFGNIMIPPLTIQPLVENSLKHGLRNMSGPGFVKVFAEISANEAVVRVVDNGSGLKNGNISFRTIDNIRERLRFFYKDSDLTVQNTEEGGVAAELIFRFGNSV